MDFKGEKRSNDTHASTTDPEARLYKKAEGEKARLGYLGHALMENRTGLVVDVETPRASGTAEREAAEAMVKRSVQPGATLGADKGYDTAEFVQTLRERGVTAHVAQKKLASAIDTRTTRHAGYAVSLKVRKRVEEIFGWAKTVGGLAQDPVCGPRQGDGPHRLHLRRLQLGAHGDDLWLATEHCIGRDPPAGRPKAATAPNGDENTG